VSQRTRHALILPTLGAAAWAIVATALAPTPAGAQYLDPGAGSIIVQAVLALLVGTGATVALYWRRITGFLSRRSKGRRQP
jgi:hypothetical protein